MRIDIQARGFDLTEGLREHTERRLKFALSWAGQDVRAVSVSLSDINGPRGGNDKRCSIQIRLPRVKDMVIGDTESDMYTAIDRAVDRAEHMVAHRLERMREHRHDHFPADEAGGEAFVQDSVLASSSHRGNADEQT